MFDDVPKGYNPTFYGWLVYDSKKALPKKSPMASLDVFDDMSLSTASCNKYDQVDVYRHVDRQIIVDMDFTTINDMNRYVETVECHAPRTSNRYPRLTCDMSQCHH